MTWMRKQSLARFLKKNAGNQGSTTRVLLILKIAERLGYYDEELPPYVINVEHRQSRREVEFHRP